MKRWFALSSGALLVACGTEPIQSAPPSMTVIDGEPDAGTAIDKIGVDAPDGQLPRVLGSLGGVIALGTDEGVFASSPGEDTFTELSVVAATDDEPNWTGAVRALARRSGGGLLVVADNGAFHDEVGFLLQSPLSESLAGKHVRSVDLRGAGDAEQAWIASDEGLHRIAWGQQLSVSVAEESVPPDVAVAVGADRAVVAFEGRVYLIDVEQSTATLVATDLGRVAAFDRSDDDIVYLGTERGLLSVDASGNATLRTLAEPGHAAESVVAVTAGIGVCYLATATELVGVTPEAATVIGPVAGVQAGGVSVDAYGSAWTIDEEALYRFVTAVPVSFEEVKGFMSAHCASCHEEGTKGAPVHDFADYVTATTYADEIVSRLVGVEAPTMPPPSTEVLTAFEYGIVIRWVAGGARP